MPSLCWLKLDLVPIMQSTQTHTYLEGFVLQVHLQQRVSNHMSEATAIEVTVRPCVTSAVVDHRELQPTELIKVISMEILMLAEDLIMKRGSAGYGQSFC